MRYVAPHEPLPPGRPRRDIARSSDPLGGARAFQPLDPARSRPLVALAAILAGLVAFLPAHPAAAVASPWAVNPQSQVRLVTAYTVAPRRGDLRLGVEFKLAPRWHVYWKNSGDAGYAPAVAFGRADGLSYPEMLWPAPHRFELAGGLEAFGYADEVIYPVQARLDSGAGTLRLTADVDYLVCEVDCVPHRYTLAVDQPLGASAQADPRLAPLLDRWWNQLPLAADREPGVTAAATIQTRDTHGQPPRFALALRLSGVSAAAGAADLFFETDKTFELGRPQLRAAPGGLQVDVPLTRKDSSAPLPAAVTVAWTATGLATAAGTTPHALTGRQPATIQPAAATAADTAPRGAGTADAPGAPGAEKPASRIPDSPRTTLAALDPRWTTLLAALALLATLAAWGLLQAPGAASDGTGRMLLGFFGLLLTFGLIYTLSLEVSPERLAGTELALLGLALLGWLRRRGVPFLRFSRRA